VTGISGAAGNCLEKRLNECDYFITPYNPGQSHWFAVILHRSGTALIIDSILKDVEHYKGAVELCRDALRKIMHLDLDEESPTMIWKHWWQQNDGNNCGLFTCVAVLFILHHTGLFERLIGGADVVLPPLSHKMLSVLREDMFVFFKVVYPSLNSRNQDWTFSKDIFVF
jgi:Ulp1 family protease